MGSTIIASFSEPEEYVAALRASFDLNMVITSDGAFHARLTRITLGHMTIVAAEEWLPRVGFITVPAGRILIALPVARQSSPVWNGIEMAPDRIITLGSSSGAHARTLQGCVWAKIIAMEANLLSDIRALTGSPGRLPLELSIWHPKREPLDAALTLHAAATRLVRRYPDLSQHREATHGLQKQLAACLIECLSDHPPEPRPGTQEHADLMARFERLTSTQGERQRTVADICRELNTSERWLQDCCKQQLGMTPTQYVKLQWLAAGRRARRTKR